MKLQNVLPTSQAHGLGKPSCKILKRVFPTNRLSPPSLARSLHGAVAAAAAVATYLIGPFLSVRPSAPSIRIECRRQTIREKRERERELEPVREGGSEPPIVIYIAYSVRSTGGAVRSVGRAIATCPRPFSEPASSILGRCVVRPREGKRKSVRVGAWCKGSMKHC